MLQLFPTRLHWLLLLILASSISMVWSKTCCKPKSLLVWKVKLKEQIKCRNTINPSTCKKNSNCIWVCDCKDKQFYDIIYNPASSKKKNRKLLESMVNQTRRLIADVNDVNKLPFIATGIIQAFLGSDSSKSAMITSTHHRFMTATAFIIQSYQTERTTVTGKKKKGKWYTWILTAAHNLMKDKNNAGDIIDLDLWKFYPKLDTRVHKISDLEVPTKIQAQFSGAKCVHVTHYIDKSVYDNDWALMKFGGKWTDPVLKIAYDNNIADDIKNGKDKWNMIVPTYYTPSEGRSANHDSFRPDYEMRKLKFSIKPHSKLPYFEQTEEKIFEGMSGSPVVKDDGDNDKVYGIVVTTSKAGKKGGNIGRITKRKYKRITDIVPGLNKGSGLEASDVKGNTAKVLYYDDYIVYMDEEYDDDQYDDGDDMISLEKKIGYVAFDKGEYMLYNEYVVMVVVGMFAIAVAIMGIAGFGCGLLSAYIKATEA